MPSMGGGGPAGGDDTSGGASKDNGGMGNSGGGGESTKGNKNKSTSVNGRKGGHYNNVGSSPNPSTGYRGGIGGLGPSFREGPGRPGPNGKTQSWTAMGGWHDVDTSLSAPSYFGGRMATTWGAKNPGQYARELGQFHDLQRAKTFNNQADAIERMVDKLRADTNAGKLSHVDYAKNYANITHGNLESLRSIGLDTTDMEKSFSPSGFMDTISSWMGGKPDKVDTYAGLAQDYLDNGMAEIDDYGNLNFTNKGKALGVANMIGVMPGFNAAPTMVNAAYALANLDFNNLKKGPNNKYQNIGQAVQSFAPASVSIIGLNPAKAVYNAAPVLGGLGDVLSSAIKAERAGLAPGGRSYYGRDPYTGRIETTNQDVIDGMLDRAENRATPNELSESYPTNINLSTPSNWPTFENTQQQPYQNQPWSWEQWNNYFR